MKRILLGIVVYACVVSAFAEAPKLSESCTACHGEQGVSANTDWPNLAAQQREYLIKEITAFRDGTRVEATMPAALLEGVSDAEIAQLADYYNSLTAASPAAPEPSSPGKHVRATCVSCHGMNGITVSSMWPNLAAQQEGYLRKQLMDYRSGKRKHPIMEVIANELSEQQIADVAKYYSQH